MLVTAPAPPKDLLSDDEDLISERAAQIHEKAAEIGNVQNQVNSTTRSFETVKNDRETVEKTLADQASQLSALQTQLSLAKASFDTESKLLSTLKERFATQTADITKAREELIRSESDLSAVRVEKAEIEGALLRDKEEARELQRKMMEVSQQVETIKVEIEKAKKDAKQQKGRLAIARKQLATKEAEKAKAEKELAESQAEVASVTKDVETIEAETQALSASVVHSPIPVNPERSLSSDTATFAASKLLPSSMPGSPDPSSPSVASVKSNNPFERLTQGGSSTPTPPSHSPMIPAFGSPAPVEEKSAIVPEAASAGSSDPFGLSQLETIPSPSESQTPLKETDVAASEGPIEAENASPRSSAASETDFFHTPMNSPIKSSTVDNSAANFPALDAVAADIATDVSKANGQLQDKSEGPTDLDVPLKEKDVEESDSDSDEEDAIPLAELKEAKTTSSFPPEQTDLSNGSAAPGNTSPKTFDDIFGVSAPTPDKAEPPVDAFGLPKDAPTNGSAAPASEPGVAGVNAFDEAMGKISSTTPMTAAAPQFSFESAFEDTFDFGGTSFTPAPPEPEATAAPAPAPATNGHVAQPLTNDDFDAFMQPNEGSTSTSPAQPTINGTKAEAIHPSNVPSFDEAFGSLEPAPAAKAELPDHAPETKSSPSPKLFPTSSPTSTKNLVPERSASPLPKRTKSPPPRSASPKARTSSSSKDSHDKEKEKKDAPPTRSSKLSVSIH
jgi:epidermal growth factor receptor substrate 15